MRLPVLVNTYTTGNKLFMFFQAAVVKVKLKLSNKHEGKRFLLDKKFFLS